MALLSMRKFAKVTGISYYNIKKYIEDGVIKADENGMLESSESIRILRKESRLILENYGWQQAMKAVISEFSCRIKTDF